MTTREELLASLHDHVDDARHTDQLKDKERHLETLAIGLFGEVGGVLAECKKDVRESEAYPRHRDRLTEELGDVLWYLLRLADVLDCDLTLLSHLPPPTQSSGEDVIDNAVELGVAAGHVLSAVGERANGKSAKDAILPLINAFSNMVGAAGVLLPHVVEANRTKILGRWPRTPEDKRVGERTKRKEERFPSNLCIEFHEVGRGEKRVIVLRCRGLNLGDRLTDNMDEPDYYRFHDVFHFSYAVVLGWSPVLRSLLKCKRKSLPVVDENQDGARAQIVEEAVSAYVFAHAKRMKLFAGIKSVDFELLKTIQDLVHGYEVDQVPLYLWEDAILQGYRVFRKLKENCGGAVELNFEKRELLYHEQY